ncbi:MAG: HNH endonuclease [Lutibacter sp.]
MCNTTSVVRVHHDPIKCDECDRTFKSKSGLLLHKRNQHSKGQLLKESNCYKCSTPVIVNENKAAKDIYCEKCFDEICTHICEKCGNTFKRLIRKNKLQRHKHCDDCKRKVSHHIDITNLKSVFDISKRTITKIFRRAKTACAICGWNDATCDIHHIISIKAGGTNDFENLIIVCPNCHRIIHSTRKYTISFLKTKSFLTTFPNWKDFYYEKKPEVKQKSGNLKRSIKTELQIENYIQHQIDCVSNSNIDFTKLGWVGEVAKLLNKKPQKVHKWMKKYMWTFYMKNCFKRKCDRLNKQRYKP